MVFGLEKCLHSIVQVVSHLLFPQQRRLEHEHQLVILPRQKLINLRDCVCLAANALGDAELRGLFEVDSEFEADVPQFL